jgi:hypothetical protein
MTKTRKLNRRCVLQILRDAFNRCVDYDYAWGHILHEEDLRANVYGYTREILDKAPDWRVFCDLTLPRESAKPDLIFFHSSDNHKKHEAIEILVEVKHWPNKKQIRSDIQKLIKLGGKFKSQRSPPTLIFIAILGDKIDDVNDGKTGKLEQELGQEFNNPKVKAKIWFRRHRNLYCGPWNESKNRDPWRFCLESI